MKPTFDMTSAVSLKSLHLPTFDLARKSSINLTPILYPLEIKHNHKSMNRHEAK